MSRQDLLSFVLIGSGFNQKWKGWEVGRWKEKNRTSHSVNLACFRITSHSLAVLHYLILWTCCAQSHNQMHFCLKCLKVLAWEAWGSYFGNLEAIQNTKPSSQMLEKALFPSRTPCSLWSFHLQPVPAPPLQGPWSGLENTHCFWESSFCLQRRGHLQGFASASASSGHNRAPCVRADISRSFCSRGFWLFVIKNNGTGHRRLAPLSWLLLPVFWRKGMKRCVV